MKHSLIVLLSGLAGLLAGQALINVLADPAPPVKSVLTPEEDARALIPIVHDPPLHLDPARSQVENQQIMEQAGGDVVDIARRMQKAVEPEAGLLERAQPFGTIDANHGIILEIKASITAQNGLAGFKISVWSLTNGTNGVLLASTNGFASLITTNQAIRASDLKDMPQGEVLIGVQSLHTGNLESVLAPYRGMLYSAPPPAPEMRVIYLHQDSIVPEHKPEAQLKREENARQRALIPLPPTPPVLPTDYPLPGKAELYSKQMNDMHFFMHHGGAKGRMSAIKPETAH